MRVLDLGLQCVGKEEWRNMREREREREKREKGGCDCF